MMTIALPRSYVMSSWIIRTGEPEDGNAKFTTSGGENTYVLGRKIRLPKRFMVLGFPVPRDIATKYRKSSTKASIQWEKKRRLLGRQRSCIYKIIWLFLWIIELSG
jgi:hypothetical protein